MRWGLIAAILVAPSPSGAADPPQPTARIVVDVSARDVSEWSARALEQAILRGLAGFQRLETVNPGAVDTSACAGGSRACLLEAYAADRVDIVMLGQLDRERLRYAVYETWLGSEVTRGSWATRGTSLLTIRQRALAALRPFMESGGLIDKRPYLTRAPRQADAEQLFASDAGPEGWVLSGLIVIALLLVPFGLRRLLSPPPRSTARTARWSVVGASALALGVGAAVVQPRVLARAVELLAGASPVSTDKLLAVLGGLAWGVLLLLLLRLALPRMPGTGQVRPRNIGPLLATWLLVAAGRTAVVIVLLAAPSAALTWAFATLLGANDLATSTLLAPLCGLSFLYVAEATVDHLAVVLDATLVIGPPNANNPWHQLAKRYVTGAIRRLGIGLDPRLVERILFLPGGNTGILAYGGGLSRPRLLIDVELLERALGPVRVEPEAETADAMVQPGAWGAAFLTPHDEEEEPAKGWERRLHRECGRQTDQDAARRRMRPKPRLIGEPATLLGVIAPLAANETVPLIANDQQDFAVVRQLLTEHYSHFEQGFIEVGYDDSDPSWKDFLFGGLLRQIGVIVRGDSLWHTVGLVLETLQTRVPGWLRRLSYAAADLGARWLSRPPAVLADAYAALNNGRDALVQYLETLRTGPSAELTAHADAARLLLTSRRIFRRLGDDVPEWRDRQRLRATLRNRLVWLSRFFEVPLPEVQRSRAGVAMAVVFAVAVAALTYFAIRDALDYHPTFVARMERYHTGAVDDGD